MGRECWAGLVVTLLLAGCGKRDEGNSGPPPPPPTLATVAGNGTSTFTGDGSAATATGMSPSRHVALDAAGNLFIPDTANYRVRRVDAVTGVITTVIGTGAAGFNGDGLPATSAELNLPMDVAVAADGTLYICEHSNHRIRKIDPLTGIVSTVAGTGTGGFSGDGGPATAAQLRAPQGIFLTASGELYIADTDNHSIRKVDLAGVITTVAGSAQAGDSGDGGQATLAELRNPNGVEVGPNGTIYIADTVNNRVRRVDATTGIITALAGTGTRGYSGDGGPAVAAELYQPHGLALDSAGHVWIADVGNHVIRRVDGNGTITREAGTGVAGYNGEGRPPLLSQLNYPMSVEIGPNGQLYVVDVSNFRIRRFPR